MEEDRLLSLFIKEIVWSIVVIILCILYFIGDSGGKALIFAVVAIYSASHIADWIIEERRRRNDSIFNGTSSHIMDDVHIHDV